MTPRPLSSDLAGMEFPVQPFSWTDKDAMLYALGVGCRPEENLNFVYEGRGPQVLPTYAVIPGMLSAAGLIGEVEIDPMMILHGEQGITLHRPLPSKAEVEVHGRLAQVWDKGKAAVLVVEGEITDDNGPLATTTATIFVRGAGGFGGERGPSPEGGEVPDREPDAVVPIETRPEQAAIYRLSGDPNPLHIDPDFAQAVGYEAPFLHGLCTFGVVGRAVLSALCDGQVERFRGLEGRFADQVYPGDTVVTKIWGTGDGEAAIQAETQRGNVVLSRGRAIWG